MPISNDELMRYNRLGIIPGPMECEQDYLVRANYCLQLRSQAVNDEGDPLLCYEDNDTAAALLEEAFAITNPIYDIDPTWLPVAFSNYHLAPWHGGCAWIFQTDENSPIGAFLQLRQGFRSNKRYLGLYHRDELIAHELAHVGRMRFEEKKFEELLAYRSSPHSWRRWLGPIVQAPWESMLFMLILLLLLMFDIYLIFTGQHETYRLLQWAKALPLGLIFAGLLRVWLNHKTMKCCLEKLRQVSRSPDAVTYRLTDAEIKMFASSNGSHITSYAHVQSETSLRWRLIKLAYFDTFDVSKG